MSLTLVEHLTDEWDTKKASGVLFPTYFQEGLSHSKPLPPKRRRRDNLWVHFVFPVPEEDMSCRSTEITIPETTDEFVPRTPLGRKLLLLRHREIQAGMKLLSADEVLEEVRRRRGELEGDETNLY